MQVWTLNHSLGLQVKSALTRELNTGKHAVKVRSCAGPICHVSVDRWAVGRNSPLKTDRRFQHAFLDAMFRQVVYLLEARVNHMYIYISVWQAFQLYHSS